MGAPDTIRPVAKAGKPSMPDDEAERVRTVMRSLVEERKYTRTGLAVALGISQPRVSQILGGLGKPGYETASKVAEFAGLPDQFWKARVAAVMSAREREWLEMLLRAMGYSAELAHETAVATAYQHDPLRFTPEKIVAAALEIARRRNATTLDPEATEASVGTPEPPDRPEPPKPRRRRPPKSTPPAPVAGVASLPSSRRGRGSD